MERAWNVEQVDQENAQRHLSLLDEFLYSKEYNDLAAKVHEAEVLGEMAEKHRRARLYLVRRKVGCVHDTYDVILESVVVLLKTSLPLPSG